MDIDQKYCPRCKVILHLDAFHAFKDGRISSYCIECGKAANVERRRAIKQSPKVTPSEKQCPKCGITKPSEQFAKNVTRASGLSDYCRECISNGFAAYYRGERSPITPKKPARRLPNYECGYVYVFEMEGYYKLGKSVNPERRLSNLNSATPFTAMLVHKIYTDNMSLAEIELHLQFAEKRLPNKEWFTLSVEDVSGICRINERIFATSGVA